MMYNPNIHHRRSIRLQEYDYANEGFYFVTICTQNRKHLFGEIADGKMVMSEAGKMIEEWYLKIPVKYPNISCRDYVVMPNHFHCIIHIIDVNVGADPRVRPQKDVTPVGADLRVRPNISGGNDFDTGGHIGPPLRVSLSRAIQWFKTMTTNLYIRGVKMHGWPLFDKRLWQRNYYEHIIRNSQSYQQILDYIQTNPLRWNEDTLFVEQE